MLIIALDFYSYESHELLVYIVYDCTDRQIIAEAASVSAVYDRFLRARFQMLATRSDSNATSLRRRQLFRHYFGLLLRFMLATRLLVYFSSRDALA